MRRSWWSAPAYAGMFLLVLLLWLPFSFKTTGLIEEWSIVGVIEEHSPAFFITPHSPLAMARLRPLLAFVHSVAHALDPDSFLFFNVFQLLFMFGKMVAVSWLVQQFLPRQRLLGFVAGALFVLYPADGALFSFRAIQIHAAVCSYLFAACLLIRFVRHPARAGWLHAAGAAVLLMFSLMTYQIALPLAVLTPLALLAFGRLSDRRFWIASGAWYAAIAVPAVYALWALQQDVGAAYEVGLMEVAPAAGRSPLADITGAIGLAYERQVIGWEHAWRMLGRYPQLRAAAIAGLAVFAATGAWIARQQARETARVLISRRRYVTVACVAAAVIVLGMAAFLALPTHRRQDFRIYFLSMGGSAVALALVLFWISRAARRFRDVAFLTLAVPFIGLGYTFALQNHQYFVNYSLIQQQVLQDTLAQAPRLAPRSFVVFLDTTGVIDDEYVFYYGIYLGTSIKYLYGDPSLDAGYCSLRSQGNTATTCTFDASSLRLSRAGTDAPSTDVVPYDRIVFLTNDVDDHFRLVTPGELSATHETHGYDPGARIAGTAPPPRAATMFSCVPALSCYREPAAPGTSYDLPDTGPIGRGWRAAEPDGVGGTFRWSLTSTAVVNVNLAPEADLALEFHIVQWLAPDVIDSLQVTLNGAEIPLTAERAPVGRVYRAILPREVLRRSVARSQLIFRVNRLPAVPTAPDVHLGIALGSLRIRPR
ncbi:MAG TPA: hypothetical protein VFV78_02825 [Vicinamibacterales bacterium]|nr:hypothetical protein [Vicinamibacterales bacterium]